MHLPESEKPKRALWQTALYFVCMIAFLVFSDWYNPGNADLTTADGTRLQVVLLQETREEILFQVEQPTGQFKIGDKIQLPKNEIRSIDPVDSWVVRIHRIRRYLAGIMGLAVGLMVWRWFDRNEIRQWMNNTWDFTKLLVPLLFGGVFIVGFLGALIPEKQVATWVGDNSLKANLIASVVGCLFYFATLTEIPILQALMERGMSQGPALALLLAGPALSLPSLLVIRSVIGNTKTLVFTVLTVIMATIVGMTYGTIVGA